MCPMEAHSRPESGCFAHCSTSTDGGVRVSNGVLLNVECIPGRAIKRFLLVQFLLRWFVMGVWILFAVLTSRPSFSYGREPLSLHLATAVCATFLVVSCSALISLATRLLKIYRAQQQWTKQRRRLVGISTMQLTLLTIAGLMYLASSVLFSKHPCSAFRLFCRWSVFVQWTCFNVIICSQVLLTHAACVWTDSKGKPQRRLIAHLLPCMAKKPKNELILEAPWLIHLPKLLLGALAQATIVMQLVVSLQVYGIFTIWHFVLVIQGMHDMAQMPVNSFRMGRILIRMVCSQDLGLGSNIVPYVTLLIATMLQGCPSCQPNYILLGLIVQCSILMSMSSLLLRPMSSSTDDTAMQAWLQRFAWTERNLASCIRVRNELPMDSLLLEREPMFCFETAVKLLYWCGFVYEHKEDRAKRASEEVAMGLYNLQHLELLRDPLTSTKCLVAWGPDTCVIAFRGTVNKQNAVHDVRAWLVPHISKDSASVGCGLGPVAAVHSGFSASWQTGLKHAVCSILQKAVKQSHQDGSNMKLLITGHSLGGVMAVLAAYDIVDLFQWQSLQVYTVGAPRPGNKAFAAKYQAKLPATWHIINPQDPVPRMGKCGMVYSRPGQRVLLDLRGTLQVRPTPLDIRLSSTNPFTQLVMDIPILSHLISLMRGMRSHLLVSYRACFVNTLKAELREPRFAEGLEGVLELANSISLSHMLQAADLDIPAENHLTSSAASDVHRARSLVVDATSAV